MGIYERDYDRGYDTGSGWRDSYSGGGAGGGFSTWSANSKLLAVLVGVFLLQNLIKGFTDWFVLSSDVLTQPWRLYGLLTYGLLHSPVNIQHLLFNGIALFFFGPQINARLGNREYFGFFGCAVFFAGLAWLGTELASGGQGLLLGASGGISAVLVLFALWYPKAQIYVWGVLPVSAWLLVLFSVLGDALGFLNPSGSRVAYAAHLGGALFGYLYYRFEWRVSDWLPGEGFALTNPFKRKPNLRVHRVSDDEDESVNPADDRVDEILRKIQAQGQDSLTREEQRVLERASRRYKNRRN